MLTKYHLPESTTTVVPVLFGRYLAHNQESRVRRAFWAADLHTGAKRLDKPTRLQAAALARVNVTYAWWAEKRQAERAAIEAGSIPLMPPTPKANSNVISMPITGQMPDSNLVDFIRSIGVERVLSAACAVEAAE